MHSTATLAEHLADMLVAAQDCLSAKRHVPALVLMYSLVDMLSWAGADKRKTDVRGRFEDWVARWLLPHLPLSYPSISATDLYGARCALLHTGTGVSDLSSKQKAKRIMYAWGDTSTEPLEFVIKQSGLATEHAALHFDALLGAIRAGMLAFLEASESDPVLSIRLAEAAAIQFASVPSGDSDA